jgi:hypothetical protein
MVIAEIKNEDASSRPIQATTLASTLLSLWTERALVIPEMSSCTIPSIASERTDGGKRD